jgi:hypothetical protein
MTCVRVTTLPPSVSRLPRTLQASTACYEDNFIYSFCDKIDRLCGLVVRVLGYRSGGSGPIPSTTKKKVVGLERGPLSLVNATEELLGRKVAASV